MASNTRQKKGMPAQPGLMKHDSAVLDLAFAMDCTASMNSYIETARNNIRNIVEEIVSSEKSDVRLALVEYRDHPPQDYTFVTRSHDFTTSVSSMRKWLGECEALGGGDLPEAVTDALHEILKLSWRQNSTKICVLISDAPPHGLHSSGDTFPNGCPAGLDPMNIVRQMAEEGITLYCVGCEPAIVPYKEFFTAIAFLTGGQYVPLRGAKALTQIIIGGAQEEISLERWMAEVDREVQQEIKEGHKVDEEAMSVKIAAKFKSKGARSKTLVRNNVALEEASVFSKVLSKCKSMLQLKNKFTLSALPSLVGFKGKKTCMKKKGGTAKKAGTAKKVAAKKVPAKKVPAKKGGTAKKGIKNKKAGPVKKETKRKMKTNTKAAEGESGVYKAIESSISRSQVLRMVRKSKARNAKK